MDKTEGMQNEKVRYFPSARFGMAMLWFFGSIALYIQRSNFGVAIVCMTLDPIENNTASNITDMNTTDTWIDNSNGNCREISRDPDEQTGEFEWDRTQRGILNSGFQIGYILTHIAGGVLVQHVGAKWVLFGGMVLGTVSTYLSEVCAKANIWLFFIARIVLGIGCGIHNPCTRALIVKWSPVYEKTIMYGILSSGLSMGSVIAFPLSGTLCADLGWQWTFYVPAIIVTVWLIFWGVFGAEGPENFKFISEKERDFIIKNRSNKAEKELPIPWRGIFTSLPCWSLFIGDICSAWGGYTNLTSGAQYMRDVLKFDIKANGGYNAIPHICKAVMTIIGSIVADSIRKHGLMSTTATRKVIQTVGFMGPAFMMLGVAFLDCERRGAALACYCLGEGFHGFTRAGIITAGMEIAPRYASVMGGISNTFGTASGIVAPIVAGLLTPNGAQEEWQKVFFIGSGLFTFGWLQFMIFGKAEEQIWAKTPEERLELQNKNFIDGIDRKNSTWGKNTSDQSNLSVIEGDQIVTLQSMKLEKDSTDYVNGAFEGNHDTNSNIEISNIFSPKTTTQNDLKSDELVESSWL